MFFERVSRIFNKNTLSNYINSLSPLDKIELCEHLITLGEVKVLHLCLEKFHDDVEFICAVFNTEFYTNILETSPAISQFHAFMLLFKNITLYNQVVQGGTCVKFAEFLEQIIGYDDEPATLRHYLYSNETVINAVFEKLGFEHTYLGNSVNVTLYSCAENDVSRIYSAEDEDFGSLQMKNKHETERQEALDALVNLTDEDKDKLHKQIKLIQDAKFKEVYPTTQVEKIETTVNNVIQWKKDKYPHTRKIPTNCSTGLNKCLTCNEIFGSRNILFEHLHEMKHMV